MQGWCGVGPAIAVLVLGIGAVPGEPSTDFGTGKVFSHVLLCAGNMALVRLSLGPEILLLVENL